MTSARQPLRRRQRLLMQVLGWVFIVAGGSWICAHLLLGQTQAAWHTAFALPAGIGILLAVRRGAMDLALVLFCLGAWLMILLLSLSLDIPTADVGRAVHHYLLPMALAQRFVLQGRSPWLHHGVPALSLLLFVALHFTGNPLGLVSEMTPSQRFNGLVVLGGFTLGLCALLFHLQQVELRERGGLPVELARALRGDPGLHLLLQPQVDAQRRICGADVLLRWQHGQRGLLLEPLVTGVAERHGLIGPLGDWMLEQTLALLARWQADPRLAGLPVALSVRGVQVVDTALAEALLTRLRSVPDLAGQLRFAIDEASLADHPQRVREFAQQCQALGVGVVLQHFGQGRSALQHLNELPLVQLKLDPSLLEGLAGAQGLHVAQTVLDLGQRLGMEVLAADVATPAQRAQLQQLGFERFQGPLLGPALRPSDFETWARQPLQETLA